MFGSRAPRRALLLVLGPVFVALPLFRTTRGLAEGWLRVAVKLLFPLPMIAAVVAVLGPVTATLGDAPIVSVRDGPVLLILLVVVVFATVMILAAQLSGGIASGIRLPRGIAALADDGRGPAAPGRVSAQPVLLGGRTATIVQAIENSRRAGVIIDAPATGPLAGTRMITGPVALAAGPVADTGSRLGQGFRRVAVVGAAAPGTR